MILFIVFCALQVADAYLTAHILERGGKEANPIMRWMVDTFGTAGLAVPKIVFCGLLWVYLPMVPDWLMLGLVGLYTLVVVSNWQEARGQRSLLDRLRGR